MDLELKSYIDAGASMSEAIEAIRVSNQSQGLFHYGNYYSTEDRQGQEDTCDFAGKDEAAMDSSDVEAEADCG